MNTIYNFQTAKRIIAGQNSLNNIAEEIKAFNGVSKVLIVAQPSMERFGYVDFIREELSKQGIDSSVEYGIKPEPTIKNIEAVAKTIDDSFNFFIGIGGGSVLDATKLLAIIKKHSCSIQSILGTNLIHDSGYPTALIPSTTGTGSEVTPNAIVTIPEEELKIGIVSKFLLPDLVIIDPLITVNLPKDITAATGMDAFTHSLESFLSKKATPLSDMFAIESMKLISKHILDSYHQGDNIQAREGMLLGSMYGGMALTSAGTAAVHAMAYPLGGKFHITHGVANSMLLPHVMRFNLDSVEDERIETLVNVLGIDKNEIDNTSLRELVIRKIEEWIVELNIPQNLKEFGISDTDVPMLSEAASKVTRLLNNNPKDITVEDMNAIYRRLLK